MMNKIDFAAVINVKNANPNGDPLNGNRPRVNYDGLGEISDVCIKRKIRNRLMDLGTSIFVQSDDNKVDEYTSLKDRADKELKGITVKKEFYQKACQRWLDVRAFGQVFPFKGAAKGEGVSIAVRGPVTIQSAFSIVPVSVSSIQITKSVNTEGDGKGKSSDTMGMKHRVDYGVYVLYGSISPQLAEKTGFNEQDAEKIKEALLSLFENDSSSARPDGSMEVYKLYWWAHNCKSGQYSSAKVHRSLIVKPKEGKSDPRTIEDYDVYHENLPDLEPKIYEGI